MNTNYFRHLLWLDLHKYTGNENFEILCKMSPQNQTQELFSGRVTFNLENQYIASK